MDERHTIWGVAEIGVGELKALHGMFQTEGWRILEKLLTAYRMEETENALPSNLTDEGINDVFKTIGLRETVDLITATPAWVDETLNETESSHS